MKHFKTYLAAMALALSGCQSATDSCGTTELWYAQPAKVWMESLPIGNGRLGAMTYGGIEAKAPNTHSLKTFFFTIILNNMYLFFFC